MKVFACKRVSGYSGGLVIVAANSAEKAFEVFLQTRNTIGC